MAEKSIAPENRGSKKISQDHLQESEKNHGEKYDNEKDGFDFSEDIIDRMDEFHNINYFFVSEMEKFWSLSYHDIHSAPAPPLQPVAADTVSQPSCAGLPCLCHEKV